MKKRAKGRKKGIANKPENSFSQTKYKKIEKVNPKCEKTTKNFPIPSNPYPITPERLRRRAEAE